TPEVHHTVADGEELFGCHLAGGVIEVVLGLAFLHLAQQDLARLQVHQAVRDAHHGHVLLVVLHVLCGTVLHLGDLLAGLGIGALHVVALEGLFGAGAHAAGHLAVVDHAAHEHGARTEQVPHAHGGLLVHHAAQPQSLDRKSTRLNSSHVKISYAVFCLKKKRTTESIDRG